MNMIKQNEKRRVIGRNQIWIAAILLVPTIFLSCFSGESPGGPPSSGQATAGDTPVEEKIFIVRTVEVSVGDLENRISLSGEVYATGRVNVVPDINGLLTKVLVNPGDTVYANQIIAYVDPSKPGMSYAESPVRSKTSGTVTSVPAVSGNQVSVQSVIAEIGNLNRLDVDIKVPEKYLSSLKPGLTGWISSRAFPDTEQSARVTEVSPVVDPRSRTVLITLAPDSTENLRPGQAVSVDLVLNIREAALTVPFSAVTERQDGVGVFVAAGEKASWRLITTGINEGGYIEVTEGLTVDDEVIVAGFEDLTDGSSIQILDN